jgi:hypothetical protein
MAKRGMAIGAERRCRPTSRRQMLALSGGAVLTVLGTAACGSSRSSISAAAGSSSSDPSSSPGTVSAPAANGVLGADLNQSLDKLDYAELKAVSGTWVRGFYLMSDADQSDPATQAGLSKLIQAAASGYGTVLTTKFQYQDKPIPVPGSPDMQAALAKLDKVLAAAMGKVDILTVGNEPFFETSKADRATPRINVFYETLALHAAQYRQAHFGANCKTKIYMGALTALYLPSARTPQTHRWMTFTGSTPSIAGTDIHTHVPSLAAAQKYLDYVLPYLRSDQTFLVTEFSLVLLWEKHMSDLVNAAFASSHGIAPGTPVWQVIKSYIQNPVDEQEWNDFLLSNSWFAAHKNFLTEQMQRFRSTGKLAVATYGVTQDVPMSQNFGPAKPPWVLNSMFCPDVCKPQPSGLPGQNLTWSEQFRALQK